MDRHNEVLSDIAIKVRQFYDRKEPFRIYHGSTNSTRPLSFRRDKTVDTSRLSNVLKIDTQKRTALVEPNVPMDRLVEATLKHGLVPPVVMEFPGITVGGGFAGSAGESSSFKHGCFDRTVNWVEMVLANGDIVIASPREKRDLFYGAAGSLGTLGVTTLLELQLVEAKSYVELTYHFTSDVSETIQKLDEATKEPSNVYVDGILFALNEGVVMTGHLTDVVRDDVRSQRFVRARDPWFYLHAKRLRKKNAIQVTEAIPIVDYLFRFDRGAFWTGAYAFKYFVTPFNRITRWVLDTYMHTRVMYHALHQSGHAKQYIIQDLALPYANAQKFITYVDQALGLYPLWLCPLYQDSNPGITLHPLGSTGKKDGKSDAMLMNVGVWGPGPRSHAAFVDTNQKLEHKVRELSGKKGLYACTYYTEDEFWGIYDRGWYDTLRQKYDAESLPTVYDKVKYDPKQYTTEDHSTWGLWLLSLFWSIWPLSGLYGVFCATFGRDYLLK
ncbi:MAG: hypothetical protein M1833_001958 [Piccolia ochrophora]|nr:MAG: hypothetical protein M1833_001958 [Piccolia ochrophora]